MTLLEHGQKEWITFGDQSISILYYVLFPRLVWKGRSFPTPFNSLVFLPFSLALFLPTFYHSHTSLFKTTFALQLQSYIVVTETVWPAKYKNIDNLTYYRKSFADACCTGKDDQNRNEQTFRKILIASNHLDFTFLQKKSLKRYWFSLAYITELFVKRAISLKSRDSCELFSVGLCWQSSNELLMSHWNLEATWTCNICLNPMKTVSKSSKDRPWA